MGNQLTPEQIHETVKALQNVGNKELQTPGEAAQERNMLVSNLKRLNGKCFTFMQHREGFELAAEVGRLTKHSYSAVRNQAIIALRELEKNTDQASSSKPNK